VSACCPAQWQIFQLDKCFEWCASGLNFRSTVLSFFINDLDDGVITKILKFADDTKTVSKVGSEDEVRVLQSDLMTIRCLYGLRIGKCYLT